MARLIIRNIGPISDIDIELTRLNIFIGPQSSGKSTIAKVISFCQWLEKDCVRQQKTSHIDTSFAEKAFVEYHNIESYIKKDSYFYYSSEILDITYQDSSLVVKRGKGFRSARISKNAYIPSERNLVSVPGIFQTKMPDNYILDFLTDWKQVRKEYTSSNITEVVPTGDSYFYNEKTDEDMIRLKGGEKLPLSQSSSGVQSITPLVVYVNYVADWIYSHPEMVSADKKEEVWEAALANVIDTLEGDNYSEKGVLDLLNEPDTPENVTDRFNNLLVAIRNSHAQFDKDADDTTREVVKVRERLSKPAYSNLVIEEPEQNLFPQTQRLLVEYLLEKHDADRDTMVITTHSPFVLYSINNCMMAYLSAKQESKEVISEISNIMEKSFTDPAKVHVWELRDGHIENFEKEINATIQDDKGLIRDNYFDRVMNNVMCDFKNMLGFII